MMGKTSSHSIILTVVISGSRSARKESLGINSVVIANYSVTPTHRHPRIPYYNPSYTRDNHSLLTHGSRQRTAEYTHPLRPGVPGTAILIGLKYIYVFD